MSPAALPPNPSLEQLKNQAKSLLKGHRSADPASAHRLRQTLSHWSERTDDEIFQTKFSLRNAQLVIAREYGFERWVDLKRHVESRRATETMPIEEDPMAPDETAADAAEALIVLGANTKIRTKAGKNPLESTRLKCN